MRYKSPYTIYTHANMMLHPPNTAPAPPRLPHPTYDNQRHESKNIQTNTNKQKGCRRNLGDAIHRVGAGAGEVWFRVPILDVQPEEALRGPARGQ